MVWIVAIIAVATVCFLLLAEERFSDVVMEGLSDLPDLLSDVLDNFDDGSIVIIEATAGDSFVQFSKESDGAGDAYLSFGFPRAPWSETLYDTVCASIRRRGYDLNFERAPSGELVSEFAVIEPIKTAVDATTIGTIAFEAMSVPEGSKFIAKIDGALDPVKDQAKFRQTMASLRERKSM